MVHCIRVKTTLWLFRAVDCSYVLSVCACHTIESCLSCCHTSIVEYTQCTPHTSSSGNYPAHNCTGIHSTHVASSTGHAQVYGVARAHVLTACIVQMHSVGQAAHKLSIEHSTLHMYCWLLYTVCSDGMLPSVQHTCSTCEEKN